MNRSTFFGGGLNARMNWRSYWMTRYSARVTDGQGTIVNRAKLLTELDYIKRNNLWNKIDYLVDNDFGKHIGDPELQVPLISFSFDDGFINDYQVYQHFAAKGIGRGTTFLCGKFVNGVNYGGAQCLTSAQITEMKNGGWDFQCHTYSHGSDYSETNDLIGLTEAQLVSEITRNNAAFAALGLPQPKHLAYPRYLFDWTTVAPVIARYRSSMRANDIVGDNYKKINWLDWGMSYDIYYNDPEKIAAAKSLIDIAFATNQPCHLMSHSGDGFGFGEDWLAGLDDILDYIYAKGLTPKTVSQFYDEVNACRDKLFNVVQGTDDGTLKDFTSLGYYMDKGTQTDKQGRILFNDTYANIGKPVVDHYNALGYSIAFWNDSSDDALNYLFPSTRQFNEQAVTVDVTKNYLVFPASIAVYTGQMLYLTGTTAPGGLEFNKKYYVKGLYANSKITIAETYGGNVIDITDVGADVKVTTYTLKEILVEKYGAAAITAKELEEITGVDTTTTIRCGCNGDIKDFPFVYLNKYGGNTIGINYTFMTGVVPKEVNYIRNLKNLTLSFNKLSGGLSNITNNYSLLTLNMASNLMNEEIPGSISNLTELTSLQLNSNLIHGTIPVALASLTKLVTLRLDSNSLSDYAAGAISTSMTVLMTVNLGINALPATAINQILADCLALHLVSGKNMTITLTGGTNAAPTGQGLIDKQALIDHGCTVTTN